MAFLKSNMAFNLKAVPAVEYKMLVETKEKRKKDKEVVVAVAYQVGLVEDSDVWVRFLGFF